MQKYSGAVLCRPVLSAIDIFVFVTFYYIK